jgi:hypothetical protein
LAAVAYVGRGGGEPRMTREAGPTGVRRCGHVYAGVGRCLHVVAGVAGVVECGKGRAGVSGVEQGWGGGCRCE